MRILINLPGLCTERGDSLSVCPCDLIKSVAPTGEEVADVLILQKLQNLGASQDCLNAVANAILNNKKMRETFPECYAEPKLQPEPRLQPDSLEVRVGDKIIKAGQSATIEIDGNYIDVVAYVVATNYGEYGTDKIKITVNGETVYTKTATLGHTGSVSFRTPSIRLYTGNYKICAEGGGKMLCVSLNIKKKGVPKIEVVSLEVAVNGRRFYQGQQATVETEKDEVNVTVMCKVRNAGNAAGSKSIALKVNGVNYGSKTLTLRPYETVMVRWDFTLSSGKTYNICVV